MTLSVDRSATQTAQQYKGMVLPKAGHSDGSSTKNRAS
jgi:hypothetical protein